MDTGLRLLCFKKRFIDFFPSLQFEEDFNVKGQASAMDWDALYPQEQYIFGDFTERLWAYLTIQQLLEKRSV